MYLYKPHDENVLATNTLYGDLTIMRELGM